MGYLPGIIVADPSSEANEANEASEGRILVIEDEALVRKALGRILRSNGFAPQFAESLESARAALHQGPPFRAAIADVSVLGVDVARAIGELRKIQLELPVLLATGGPEPELSEQVGACTFLAKPFTPRTLMAQLDAVFAP